MNATDRGLLITFLLLGAISSVVPFFGPLVAAPMGSYRFLGNKSSSLKLFSYLAFMVGMVIITLFLWSPLSPLWEANPDSDPIFFPAFVLQSIVVSLLFGIGFSESENPTRSLF